MNKYFYYIDYGSGFVLINPHKNQTKPGIERAINPFIQRKVLEGSFELIEAEALAAFTFFITNGNYEAPIQIWEHDVLGSGTLVYEGWALVKSRYDFNADIITIEKFKTNDIYTDFLPFLDVQIVGEDIPVTDDYVAWGDIAIQGLNVNSNQLFAYNWSGTAWTITGNALSIPNIGRVSMDTVGGGIAVYDNVSRKIQRYFYSAPNWAPSTLGTSFQLPNNTGNGAITAYTSNRIAFIDDFSGELKLFQMTTGTWTQLNFRQVERCKFPSLAFAATNLVAMVDEGTKMLRMFGTTGDISSVVGTPLSVGDVLKPDICALDGANTRIALVDAESQTLRTMEYTAGIWTQIGESLKINGILEPKISQETTNVINLYDAYQGDIQKYTFSGTAWAATGNPTTVGGGYQGAVAIETGILGLIQSDTYMFDARLTRGYRSLVNGILSANGIYSVAGTDYVLNRGTNGATFDTEKLTVNDLSMLRERYAIGGANIQMEKYTLKDVLAIAEIFQNYWYLDDDPVLLGDIQIKFAQPDNFSGTGTNFVSSFLPTLDKKEYDSKFLINRERVTFNNERNADFVGQDIEYNRDNQEVLSTQINYTTDLGYIQGNFNNVEFEATISKRFLAYGDGLLAFNTLLVEAGTGVGADPNVKNEVLSKTRIFDDYWKNYRYSDQSFNINGAAYSSQTQIRNMIRMENVDLQQTNFPTSIGSIDWGTLDTYITKMWVDLETFNYTFESVILDL